MTATSQQHPQSATLVKEPVPVNLTDTVGVGWYILAALCPLIGFIAAIVFMAKSKIGPSIALFMTATLSMVIGTLLIAAAQLSAYTG